MPRRLLYYITDRKAFPGSESSRRSSLLEKISEAASAGVDYIQLREKDLPTRGLESLAQEALQIIHAQKRERGNVASKTKLLINSRTDIAVAIRADGVHLRANDISPQEVRKMWKGKEKCGAGAPARELYPQEPLIAVSCHSPAEVTKAAADQAAFAVFAPVFEKKDAPSTTPTGLLKLREACQTKIPVLALGGITLENAQSCLEAGAAGVAAIRIFQENDIAKVVRALCN